MSKVPTLEHLEQFLEQVNDLIAQTGKDRLTGVPITIPAAGWAEDETADYPHYCDIPVDGVTAQDRAKIDLAPAAQGTAAACGLCPSCETLEGKIRLRAAIVPVAAMAAECWIEQGKE